MVHSDFDIAVYSRFYSQIIDFTNAFYHTYITSGDPFYIELPRSFNIDGGKCDVVIRLNKILYGQSEASRLWYETFCNVLLDLGFVVSKVYPCLFMSKTEICVVYVDYCLFWEYSQSDIDNVIKSCNEDRPSYNREHSKVESAS